MGMTTVRNIPDEVHDALRAQAKAHGRSAEAEVRVILEAAVKPETRIRMGDALAALAQQVDLTDDDAAALEQSLKDARDKTPAKPMSFDYVDLTAAARRRGLGLPLLDGYIAAIAAAEGFKVASRDIAPFEAAGVLVIDPWDTRL